MTSDDEAALAGRLYDRLPAVYRVRDAQQGLPLLALLRAVSGQVVGVRQDLDALWDNVAIETCEDWVVPYIGALLGTNLLAHPVGQSNRADVANTVAWRRQRGTPAMLRALAQAISEWPTGLAEFFQTLGWSQHLDHLRLERPLTPDLRDPYRLSRLGHADDLFGHAADLKPARPLDQARVGADSLGVGRMAWGTPGRYQIKNIGLFVHRLRTFAVDGATPAAAPPGAPSPTDAACLTFDPLHRETPLFARQTQAPLGRAAFDKAPWAAFGTDLAVRQFGVLLASEVEPAPVRSSSREPFTFGDAAAGPAGLALHPTEGLRLLEPRAFELGGAHFVVTASWEAGGARTRIGGLSSLYAALGRGDAYQPGATVAGPAPGRLVLTVQTGRDGLGWPGLPAAPTAHFPGAVVALRAARTGAAHADDARYVYLPAAGLAPTDVLTCYVADDGSTYTGAGLDPPTLARAAEGQVQPARPLTAGTQPAGRFTVLDRRLGLRLPDPGRFGDAGSGAAVLVEAELFTGSFQLLGALATVDRPRAVHPQLELLADPWRAFSHAPSRPAVRDLLPAEGLLTIRVRPLAGGDFLPAAELVVRNRDGQALLVYLPEVPRADAEGVRLFVAQDGSTWFVPADPGQLLAAGQARSLDGLGLARAAAGQVLPIPGRWPLEQRRPVAANLCRCERNVLLRPGELGIDPELGRFALAPGDPSVGAAGPGDPPAWPGSLSVDYVEAFGDEVGARAFDRQLGGKAPATRLVARSGDARAAAGPAVPVDRIHPSLAEALARAVDGDVIEIADSATYAEPGPGVLADPRVTGLTIRAAAGRRPCLTFYQAAGVPVAASLLIQSPLARLELDGLLISGGPLRITGRVGRLLLRACTLDPLAAGAHGSLVASDPDRDHGAEYLLCRCIVGGVRTAAGVSRLVIADSIVDQQGGLAVGGVPGGPLSPPGPWSPPLSPPMPADPPARAVQLERVTVLGRVRCELLEASECLLDELAEVDDRQAGCIRFSRFELGSALPRRYQCVPSEEQAADCAPPGRCLAPLFVSRRFGRPAYGQLAAGGPPAVRTASEAGAEVGAFAGRLDAIRLANLETKLREFLPIGLSALVIAET
jgi:hypothetical protein